MKIVKKLVLVCGELIMFLAVFKTSDKGVVCYIRIYHILIFLRGVSTSLPFMDNIIWIFVYMYMSYSSVREGEKKPICNGTVRYALTPPIRQKPFFADF